MSSCDASGGTACGWPVDSRPAPRRGLACGVVGCDVLARLHRSSGRRVYWAWIAGGAVSGVPGASPVDPRTVPAEGLRTAQKDLHVAARATMIGAGHEPVATA